jgi:hypothetical protein
MTYEQYEERGFKYADYCELSQFQRLRGIIRDWRASKAKDKCIRLCALWDATNEEEDWIRTDDWWHPRQWHAWRWGFDQCQNFHRIGVGPMTVLIAT